MGISDQLRRQAVDELIHELGFGMELEGHVVPEDTLFQEAQRHLDFMIENAAQALKSEQLPGVIVQALSAQGLEPKTAQAIVIELLAL